MLEMIESQLHNIITLCVYLMEAIGVAIIVVTALRCFRKWVRHMDHVRMELGNGIALALQFKLAGEVMRTAIARTWEELGMVGAIFLLRAAITLLIHWELHHEEKKVHAKSSSSHAHAPVLPFLGHSTPAAPAAPEAPAAPAAPVAPAAPAGDKPPLELH